MVSEKRSPNVAENKRFSSYTSKVPTVARLLCLHRLKEL